MRRESRRILVRLGLRTGQGVASAAPLGALLVFALVSYKPAVTPDALVVGLALILRHALEPACLAFEVRKR
ncbi:MAG: hypothetical protein ACRDHK_05335 [Actinomycetota bacterium]